MRIGIVLMPGRIRISININMEIRIRIGIKTIHNTVQAKTLILSFSCHKIWFPCTRGILKTVFSIEG
jgi:hypothetical protein